jgi:hypothetical protein
LSDFKEGARHLIDPCPKCGQICIFSSDFKKFGTHYVRVCLNCKAVYHNGKKESDLEMPNLTQPAP